MDLRLGRTRTVKADFRGYFQSVAQAESKPSNRSQSLFSEEVPSRALLLFRRGPAVICAAIPPEGEPPEADAPSQEERFRSKHCRRTRQSAPDSLPPALPEPAGPAHPRLSWLLTEPLPLPCPPSVPVFQDRRRPENASVAAGRLGDLPLPGAALGRRLLRTPWRCAPVQSGLRPFRHRRQRRIQRKWDSLQHWAQCTSWL